MKNKSNINYKNLLIKLQKLHLSKTILIDEKLYKKPNLLLENIYAISLGIYACVDGIKLLSLDKNVISGNILLRTIFESWVNIRYISMDKTHKRAVAFILSDVEYKKKLIQDIIDNFDPSLKLTQNTKFNSIEQCKNSLIDIDNEKNYIIEILKNEYKINLIGLKPWNNNIKYKSDKTSLISDYNIIYKNLCKYTHLNSTSLKTIFKRKSNKFEIKIKKSARESNILLGATCAYYYNSLKDIFNEFKIYDDNEFEPLKYIFETLNLKYSSNN